MVSVILIVFLAYYVLMIVLLEGWRRIPYSESSGKNPESLPFISILIPVRNEALNISVILASVTAQNYPQEKFEVILVDDHSEDNTVESITAWNETNLSRCIRVIRLQGTQSGKKSALTAGIQHAKGEIIVTTDADCSMHSNWLTSLAGFFQQDVHMVCGPVNLLSDKTFFSALQQMEFDALIGTGAATLSLGKPTMCNGANLAYRKKTFEEVDGFTGNNHIASGDDEFLLREIVNRYPGGVQFAKNPECIVYTKGAHSIMELINQRVRWAGKWRSHGLSLSAGIALFIFLFHCSVLALIPLVWLGLLTLQDVGLLLGGKMLVEGIFITRILKFFNNKFSLVSFFALQIVYPLYVIFFGLTANFLGARWKGRKI